MQTVKRHPLVMNKELPGNPWRFESSGKWTRAMLSSVSKQTPVNAENSGSPDELLRAIIDACVSNVAVLDESGAMICASRTWSLLEQDNYSESGDTRPRSYFASCRRFAETDSEQVKAAWIDEQRAESQRAAFAAMKAKYQVVLPGTDAEGAAAIRPRHCRPRISRRPSCSSPQSPQSRC